MAKITGLRVRDRWAGWHRAPFTSASNSQVAVFEKLPLPRRPTLWPGPAWLCDDLGGEPARIGDGAAAQSSVTQLDSAHRRVVGAA